MITAKGWENWRRWRQYSQRSAIGTGFGSPQRSANRARSASRNGDNLYGHVKSWVEQHFVFPKPHLVLASGKRRETGIPPEPEAQTFRSADGLAGGVPALLARRLRRERTPICKNTTEGAARPTRPALGGRGATGEFVEVAAAMFRPDAAR
jgi:hypothetical protein